MTERLSRAERRQILKDDAPWVGKPLNPKAIGRALEANTRHLALTLRDTQAKKRASLAAAFAARLLDHTVIHKVEAAAACSKGCCHCCRTFVSATIPEILYLAASFKAKPATAARIQDAALRAAHIPQAKRDIERITCPVLESALCSEYTARPLVCRSLQSKSLDACLRIFERNSGEQLPHVDGTVDIRAFVLLMLQAALTLANLPHQHYELTRGLAAALSFDDSEERWLAGEPLFAGVEIDAADMQSSILGDTVKQLAAAIQPTL